jgi:hypothetical protein
VVNVEGHKSNGEGLALADFVEKLAGAVGMTYK